MVGCVDDTSDLGIILWVFNSSSTNSKQAYLGGSRCLEQEEENLTHMLWRCPVQLLSSFRCICEGRVGGICLPPIRTRMSAVVEKRKSPKRKGRRGMLPGRAVLQGYTVSHSAHNTKKKIAGSYLSRDSTIDRMRGHVRGLFSMDSNLTWSAPRTTIQRGIQLH